MSSTTNQDAAAQVPGDGQPAETQPPEQPGFRSRGQARRRARFLRRARELAYRDLGGLVFNLHRFGARNDALVLAKLATLGNIDAELRSIEAALQERHPVTVLREAGITACPRCAAIHGSEDRFCPNCGLPMGRHADLPIAGAPGGADVAAGAATAQPRVEPTSQPLPGSGPGAQIPPAFQPQPTVAPAPVPDAATPAAAVAPSAPGSAQAPSVGRTPPVTRTMPQADVPHGAGRSGGPEESTEILHPRSPGS